jgi:hypothetical protein
MLCKVVSNSTFFSFLKHMKNVGPLETSHLLFIAGGIYSLVIHIVPYVPVAFSISQMASCGEE